MKPKIVRTTSINLFESRKGKRRRRQENDYISGHENYNYAYLIKKKKKNSFKELQG